MFSAVIRFPLPLLLATGLPVFAQTAGAPATSAPSATPAVQVQEQDSFLVVGLTVRTTNDKEAGQQGLIPQLWQAVLDGDKLSQIPNRISDGLVVVYSDYASDSTGAYDYTLGVRVSSADKIPDGFVVRKIQGGRYAVIHSEQGPPQQVIPALWQKINAMTPLQLGGQRAFQTDFETYPDVTDWGNLQMAAHIGLR
jgi:predicted transcriptional regulator YdeE